MCIHYSWTLHQEWQIIAPRLRKKIEFGQEMAPGTASIIEDFLFFASDTQLGSWGKVCQTNISYR
jgi:hypothetical protein